MKREIQTYLLWSICVTIWVTLCFIIPYFIGSPAEGWRGVLSLVAYVSACSIGAFFLICLTGSNRYLCAIFLPLLALTGSALSFYLIGYRTTLTPMLVDAILHTNMEEAIGVLSWQMVVWVVINGGVAYLFIRYRWKRIKLSHEWLYALVALLLGVGYLTSNARIRTSLYQRFPYNVPYVVYTYYSLQQSVQGSRAVPNYEVISHNDSLTVVLILGEAVRADHLQLNGYPRETTPRLSQRRNVVSYPSIYSEQTHTLASLPYILTRADSVHEDYQYTETSFISIFREAGFYTAWVSNQDLGDTFSPFLLESDTVIFANAGKSVYVFTKWLDEELLPPMNSIRSMSHNKALYILHSIGSHWYYNNHVPDEMQFFQPVTTNKMITGNTDEQIINSYDNTIRYMDYFVDSIIASLENEKALLIYQSDHGEALGEEGDYLHANDAEITKYPATFIWYSDKYAAAYPDKMKALNANKDKRYRTDYVFYSILSAAGMEAEGNNKGFDIFKE